MITRCFRRYLLFKTSPAILKDQIISFLSDDRIIVTTNGRQKFDLMPGIDASYNPGLNLEELIELHAKRTDAYKREIRLISNDADMAQHVDDHTDRRFKHMLARGIIKPVSSNAE